MVRQYHVYFVNLDPTIGMEIKKARPCVVLSPNDMNSALGTVIIAPMTTTLRKYPSRIEIRFSNKFCEICLDQIRSVDESQLQQESMGRLNQEQIESIKDVIAEIFQL